jgi:hypothetical protein
VAPVVTKAISKVPDPDPLSTVKRSVKDAIVDADSPKGATPVSAIEEAASTAPNDADAEALPLPLRSDRTDDALTGLVQQWLSEADALAS